jgi:expansin (peptidoglycan-binding protein)
MDVVASHFKFVPALLAGATRATQDPFDLRAVSASCAKMYAVRGWPGMRAAARLDETVFVHVAAMRDKRSRIMSELLPVAWKVCLSRLIAVSAAGLVVGGCDSPSDSSGTGGADAVGAAAAAGAGPAGVTGGSAGGDPSEAASGSDAAGGSQAVGGSESTGGSQAAGGNQSTGGNQLTGGSKATGGRSSTSGWTGPARSGEATYYNGSGTVNCSYEGINDSMNIAALNSPDWSNSDWCGACADVQGPNGTVRVRIVDQCPECASGDLDLSPTAFDQIANRADGRVQISWNFVACDVSGPVSYRFKDGTTEYWTEILVDNHRLPIASLQWSTDGQNWQSTQRQSYNFFTINNPGPGPLYVRITAVDGQVLEDTLPTVQAYLEVDGQGQFR